MIVFQANNRRAKLLGEFIAFGFPINGQAPVTATFENTYLLSGTQEIVYSLSGTEELTYSLSGTV